MREKNNILLIITLLISILSYSQKVGIGTNLPTEMLDVNGKIRIRNVEELPGTGIRPLYINSDGIIGRRVEEAPLTQIFSASSRVEYHPNDGVNQFNSGNNILTPLNINDATVNNLDVLNSNNNTLKIPYEGFYSYNAFINLVIGSAKVNDLIYLFVKIECSKDNGNNWEIITASRPVVSITIISGQMVVITLPPTIFKHNQGDLIRLTINRSKAYNTTFPFLGDPVKELYFSYLNNVPAYTLIINKI